MDWRSWEALQGAAAMLVAAGVVVQRVGAVMVWRMAVALLAV